MVDICGSLRAYCLMCSSSTWADPRAFGHHSLSFSSWGPPSLRERPRGPFYRAHGAINPRTMCAGLDPPLDSSTDALAFGVTQNQLMGWGTGDDPSCSRRFPLSWNFFFF